MAASSPHASERVARIVARAWWVLLIGALALFAFETARRIQRVDLVTNLAPWSADAPVRDDSSVTGLELGERRLIVPGQHRPSFRWIMEAQLCAHRGWLRLRHIDYDARPGGRDIERTSPYRWWLTAVGWAHAVFRGESLGYGIERGALFADPILFAVLLVFGAAYVARYASKLSAAAYVGVSISLFPLAANFQPGAPDPHSLAWVLALGSLLPLVGCSEQYGRRRARHFAAAGIFGGLGLWNEAATQAPVLLALILGAAVFELSRRRADENGGQPMPWRSWAWAGALTTLVASVFEFAPSHFSWSLDAVNPVHAVAWWGAGELLVALGQVRRGAGWKPGAGTALLWGGALLAVVAWPVAGMIGHSGALLAPDFYALELANHPAGGIAADLPAWHNRPGAGGAKLALLLPVLVVFVVGLRAFQGRLASDERARHVFVIVATAVLLVLGYRQLRWWNAVDVFALAGLVVVFASVKVADARWQLGGVVGAVLAFLPGLVVAFPESVTRGELRDFAQSDGQTLVERDFAYWLGRRAGSSSTVLFSSPIFSDAAAFYGGFDLVVSSDHTNVGGYQTAARIAGESIENELAILLRSRGVTHVAIPLWDPAIDRLVRIGGRVDPEKPLPESAFAVAVTEWAVPLWMRPMNYTVPAETGLQAFDVRSVALQAEQAPELALSRLADLFLERGHMLEARAVAESLKAYPRSVVALGAIARVELAHHATSELEETLRALIPYLSRRSARDIPADRRVSLAAVLMQTKHEDLGRSQVDACIGELGADELRTFTPGAVVELLRLCRSLDLSLPDSKLESVAMGLVPPKLRDELRRN